MMESSRHPARPAPARGADRLRLPARLRRDAAADRPDRRPARPRPGAGRRAGALRGRLPGHHRVLRPAEPGRGPVPAGDGRWRAGPGHAGARRRPLPRRPPRRAPRRRLRRPGARQRRRPAVRRADPGRLRLAGDLRGQPRRRRRSWPWPSACGVGPQDAESSCDDSRRTLGHRRLGGPGASPWSRLAAAGLVVVQPTRLVTDVTWGQLFIPVSGDGRWLTPLGHRGDRGRAAVRCALLHRPAPAGRPTRLVDGGRCRPTCPARSSWRSPWAG